MYLPLASILAGSLNPSVFLFLRERTRERDEKREREREGGLAVMGELLC